MIRGNVNARNEAVVTLRLTGPSGLTTVVDAVVDTGFSSSLTLPQSVIEHLELVFDSFGSAILGDGTIRKFDIFKVGIEWGGTVRSELASAIGDGVLLDMALLEGYRIRIEVARGGTVEITPINADIPA